MSERRRVVEIREREFDDKDKNGHSITVDEYSLEADEVADMIIAFLTDRGINKNDIINVSMRDGECGAVVRINKESVTFK